jgi:alkanesulfonate monooxygenase SsuD/methylene tetrahydromethanopterin reductase-like flavin-dependent oxidoreductase (luciferase family)
VSEIAFVDALSHGRLVLGVGSGYQPYEFERFGEDLKENCGISRNHREGIVRRFL